jgi:hypothetical protein
MIQEPLAGHQKVQFDTLLEAIEFREECPLCASTLSLTCSSGQVRVYTKYPDRSIMRAPEWSYKRSYCLAIRNISNTADFIRVWDDGVTAEIFSETAMYGKDKLFYFPISLSCKECNSYRHQLRIGINLSGDPGTIEEVKMVSISVKLDKSEGMVIRSYFFPPRSELIINSKVYQLDFVDIDVTKSKELFERFSSIVPFI